MYPDLSWMDLVSMACIGEVDVKFMIQVGLYLGYPRFGKLFWLIMVLTSIHFNFLDS